jgi:hypothetical protein
MTLLVIEATVADPDGNTGTGSVTVEVLDPPAELAPKVPANQRESLPDFAERAMQRWGQVR